MGQVRQNANPDNHCCSDYVYLRERGGISWTICKSFAPCSRQITMPVPHDSVSAGQMPFLPPNQQYQITEGILYIF